MEAFFGGDIPDVAAPYPSPSGTDSDTNSNGSAHDNSPTGSQSNESNFSTIGGSDWYPNYNGDWSLGRCQNDLPLPSGRPSYPSHLQCCEMAYGGQASGYCLSFVSDNNDKPAPIASPSKNESISSTPESPKVDYGSSSWYPDYNADWSMGSCKNDLPLPSGRPSYSSQLECCSNAYGGQASGYCLSSATTGSTNESTPSVSENNAPVENSTPVGQNKHWYANYNPQYALGKCIDDEPVPDNRPWYDSPTECCNRAYGGQASGACLAFATNGMSSFVTNSSSASLRRGDLMFYTCGANNEVPIDSMIVDIAFDYEIVAGDVILPDLKKKVMDHLAGSLGCDSSFQSERNLLRKAIGDDALLGFQTSGGSDVIDGTSGKLSFTIRK